MPGKIRRHLRGISKVCPEHSLCARLKFDRSRYPIPFLFDGIVLETRELFLLGVRALLGDSEAGKEQENGKEQTTTH